MATSSTRMKKKTKKKMRSNGAAIAHGILACTFPRLT
jgi:hypothetical protein